MDASTGDRAAFSGLQLPVGGLARHKSTAHIAFKGRIRAARGTSRSICRDPNGGLHVQEHGYDCRYAGDFAAGIATPPAATRRHSDRREPSPRSLPSATTRGFRITTAGCGIRSRCVMASHAANALWMRNVRNWLSGMQPIEQRLRPLHIARVEPRSENSTPIEIEPSAFCRSFSVAIAATASSGICATHVNFPKVEAPADTFPRMRERRLGQSWVDPTGPATLSPLLSQTSRLLRSGTSLVIPLIMRMAG
jgi:hypothetical protein